MSLPVYTPSTSETFATYGVLDGGAIVQPVLAPTDVIPQFGGLEVSTSSTTLQALTDAVLYLTDYRYASSDGLASQLLAISSLRDVLDAFDAPELPSAGEIDAAMDEYIDRARRRCRTTTAASRSGCAAGRASRSTRSRPRTPCSSPATPGYAVPADAITRGVDALGAIEQFFDPAIDEQTAWTLRAYALHVRALAGQADPAAAQALYDEAGDELPLDGARLAVAGDRRRRRRSRAIEQRLANVAVDTAGAVTFTTGITDDGAAVTLPSDRRTDGLILDALLAVRPDSDLVPKVVRGLQAGQGADGRWDNVQENAFILLALRHYFDTFEGTDPRLRGPGLGRRALRRRAGVRRPVDDDERDLDPDGRRHRRRRRRPSRSATRAPAGSTTASGCARRRRRSTSPRSTAASSSPARTRRSTTRPTSPATPTARGTSAPALGSGCG